MSAESSEEFDDTPKIVYIKPTTNAEAVALGAVAWEGLRRQHPKTAWFVAGAAVATAIAIWVSKS